MRILVFGAGAVGSFLAGYLAAGGHEITAVGRAGHIDAIRRNGLRIKGIFGERRAADLQVVETVTALPPECRFDWVFITVKAYDTEAAAASVAPLVSAETVVCSVQNGLGNYEKLQRHIARERIALGRIITGIEIEPGEVTATVTAGPLRLGVPDLEQGPARAAEHMVAAFCATGLECEYSRSIIIDLWAKVLYNCALNGLATVLDGPYGILLSSRTTRYMMKQIVHEAYAVAAALGIVLSPATPEAYVALLMDRLLPDTAAHYPSMHADIRRGKPTEIGAMNGALERLGAAQGVSAPQNALVHRLVREQERFCGISSRE